MTIVLMGVSGSGKTTIGKQLADSLNWQFYDADDFHSAKNIEKMQAAIPLEDSDNRIPWLQTIADAFAKWLKENQNIIMACSALKESYRQLLLIDRENIKFIYLKGSFKLIQKRLKKRENHFMSERLLKNQFDVFEEPYGIPTVDISKQPEEIVQLIAEILRSF